MKKYLLLHVGFEQPTPEIMQAWQAWFASIAERQVEQAGFGRGIEITASGMRHLPWDRDAMTGYNIVEAESLEAAAEIARSNPLVAAIRVYELR